WYGKAITTLEPLRRHKLPLARANLSAAYHGRGCIFTMLRRQGEALESFKVARDLMKELVKEHPGMQRYAHQLAITYQAMADQQSSKDALASRLAARALLERLVRTYPSVLEYTVELAAVQHGASFLYIRLGDRKEALKCREAVCRLEERLVDLQPKRLDYK